MCILLCLISFALHCFVKFIHVIAAYFSVLNSTPLYNIPQFIYFVVLCFCFWLCWVFVTSQGLSLVAVSGSYCSLRCAGLSCCVAWALGCVSVSSCITWGSVVVGHRLSCSWHVGSSQTRDQVHVPSLAGRFLTTGPPGKSPFGCS